MTEKELSNDKIFEWKTAKRLAKFAKPYRKTFWFLVFLTILVGLLGPIRPYMVEYTINNHIAHNNYGGLLNMTLIMLGLLFLQAYIQYLHTYLSGWLGQSIIKDIRVSLYKHIVNLRLRFFDKTPIGRLITRNISDIETLANVFTEGLAALIGDLLQIIFILLLYQLAIDLSKFIFVANAFIEYLYF